ncbi:hypothetical protein HPB49_004344 [Dermacentor silvarum]|uniref:Uncharacterized protein n=1 Tax=Dermacentor silvarum TaxID=543639 RepID=A0ACB8DUV8_DERSI|nr:hypothetical protein HPB49_004344 [Dermacentor silvarum]
MGSRGTYHPTKDLKTKVEILYEVEKGTLCKTEIAKKYDITKSTLSTYLKNRESIIAGYEQQKIKPSRKRLRTSAHPQLEDALVMWIRQVRSQNLPLSGPLIAAKVDSGVQTFSVITDAEIIQSTCPQQAASEDPPALSGEDSDAGDECNSPSAIEAASALDIATRYFSCQQNADAGLELICKLRAMFIESLQDTQVQARITDYFT